jgi:hypothetical protein
MHYLPASGRNSNEFPIEARLQHWSPARLVVETHFCKAFSGIFHSLEGGNGSE